MEMASNRRALIGALGVATIAACTASLPACAVASDGLDAAIARSRRAIALSTAYHRRVYGPCRARLAAAEAAVPPVVIPFTDDVGAAFELRSDDCYLSRYCLQRIRLDERYRRNEPAYLMEAAVKLRDGMAERDHVLTRLRDASGVDAARKRADDLGSHAVLLLDAAAAYPVTTAAELLRKLAFIDDVDWWDDDDARDAIRADLVRIAGREG